MITLFFAELPFTDVRGCVRKSSKGYSVLINTNEGISREEMANTIRHEMNHIRLNHFDSDKSLQEIEREANSYKGESVSGLFSNDR